MNILKRFVAGLGQQNAPFGFAPDNPNASYQAGLSYIGDIGANLMANNQGGVDPWANLGDSMQQAKATSADRNRQQYTAQQLMEEAAARKAEREQAAAELQKKNEWLKSISDPRVRATLEANPGLIDNYIAATDPAFQQPEKPQLTADMQNYLFAQQNPEFAGFLNQGKGGSGADLPRGYRWKEDGSGAEPIPGVSLPGTKMRLTEQQSKDTVYYTRGKAALENLDKNEKALTGAYDSVADSGWIPGGNYLTSTEYQTASQAGREFLAAILRKDTGAAITKDEMDTYGAMYLPRPGDGEAVLAQKRQAREIALNAIKSILPQQQTADVPEGITPEEWAAMTEEERAAWQ